MFKSLIIGASIALLGLLVGQRAEAATLNFAVSGDYTFNWTLESEPTPDEVLSHVFILENVAGRPAGEHLVLFDASEGGGFAISRPVNDFLISAGDGLIFGGTLANPVFAPGSFHFTHDYLTNNTSANINFKISATPTPAALPLLASALGVLGFIGRGRKKAA